jgi:hypothetical protein
VREISQSHLRANAGDDKTWAADVSWLQPAVLEFRRERTSEKITAKICWASPGVLEKAPPHMDFRVETSRLGMAKPSTSSDSGADLGWAAAAVAEVSVQAGEWKEMLCTQDQVVEVHLEPSSRYLVRITSMSGGSRRPVCSPGIPSLIETPNWISASLEDIILSTGCSSTPLDSSAPLKEHMAVSPWLHTSPSVLSPAGRTSRPSANRSPKTIPGPLFLKELTTYGNEQRFLCGVFEWLPQTYFDANILDLQLVDSGESLEPHDFVMVFAGSEHQVRVHNILPGSSYRVRLRAGDFVDGELSTVVERATLPFVTPTWSELLAIPGRPGQESGTPLRSPEVSVLVPSERAVSVRSQYCALPHAPC